MRLERVQLNQNKVGYIFKDCPHCSDAAISLQNSIVVVWDSVVVRLPAEHCWKCGFLSYE